MLTDPTGRPAEPTPPQTPREILYRGDRINVVACPVPDRTGGLVRRELVTHPGAVVILPLLDDGRVCLIKNWRYSVNETLLELPAGTLSPGEPTLTAARRELAEETGFTADRWRLLTEFWVSPGVYGEKMWLYLARDLTPGPTSPDDTEHIQPHPVDWDEAVRLALHGGIRDAKTILGILLWDRLRHDEQE